MFQRNRSQERAVIKRVFILLGVSTFLIVALLIKYPPYERSISQYTPTSISLPPGQKLVSIIPINNTYQITTEAVTAL